MFKKRKKTNRQRLSENKKISLQEMIDILDKCAPKLNAGEYNSILLNMGFELLALEKP